jgi:DNA end-binding protein Ku
LQLGPVTVPVKAYPAIVAPTSGPLHQIHVGCGRRISQRKVCPDHGEVSSDEIGKAFEFAPNDQLAISQDDLDSLSPADDQTIHLEHLLPGEKFDCSLLSGRTLYLTPTHPAAGGPYATVLSLLSARGVWAVGQMVLSDQRRCVAIRASDQRLLLFVLHWPEHRRMCPTFEIDTTTTGAAEVRSLEKALAPLHKSFVWETYRDESTERLHDLIAAKVASRSKTVVGKPQRSTAPGRNRARQAA